MAKKRIAVLGGGVGAMSAAWALTEAPDWQEKYEITVYQMGWRLGGKGANSRNPAMGQRIEEHGLHIWFGFYDNSFRVMQGAYQECFKKKLFPDSPLQSWTDAFKQHNILTAMEEINGEWKAWPIEYPFKAGVPGFGEERLMTSKLYFRMLVKWAREHLRDLLAESKAISWISFAGLIRTSMRAIQAGLSAADDARSVDGFAKVADEFRQGIYNALGRELDSNDALRRKLEIFDLLFAMTRGLIVDRVLQRGFESIDHYDAREWLKRHGSRCTESSMVRGMYDLVFAYRNGDINQPSLAAGTAVRTLLRILLTYKGTIVYKMQAGMGETVFSPIYKALESRGVKFAFFHKVTNLGVSADGGAVDAIDIDVQARVKPELAERGYQPLYSVGGVPCWPDEPFYDQLVDGDTLQCRLAAAGRTLESNWWTDCEEKITLRRGEDFDDVVLGISIGAFPFIAREMMGANRRFRAMVENLPTVETQAFQMWMNKSIEELGWEGKEPAIVGAYTEPVDTWADLSHLIGREEWPAEAGVKNIAYFCTAMTCPDTAPVEDAEYPARQKAQAKHNALEFLRTSAKPLWPSVSDAGTGGLDWKVLVDQAGRTGEKRFEAQYWRANVEPSDRYVLSVRSSTHYRLKSGDSGFANVVMAGDWTDNGINLGCVEAATVSGLMAARTLCGYPKVIFGEEAQMEQAAELAAV